MVYRSMNRWISEN